MLSHRGYDSRVNLPHEIPEPRLNICHKHNLVIPENAERDRKFGIRVTLPRGDTFTRLLGENWEKIHWFATEAERDTKFAEMAERHGYYRTTDNPTQVLEKIIR